MTHRIEHWLYRGKRPNRMARIVNGAWGRLGARGVGPRGLATLEVTGRVTGKPVSLPAAVADYDGQKYLVSMLGDGTNWVRNVRAANGQAVLCHGHRDQVRLVEVEPTQRAPIIRRYLDCAPGARPHVPADRRAPIEEFEAIAERYPVFWITGLPEG